MDNAGKKISVAVLASGRGSNFSAIADGITSGEVNAEIKVLITNNPDAKAIDVARKNSIAVEIIEKRKFKSREKMDLGIKKVLDRHNVDLVVLAGYMLLITSKELLNAYRNKIINIHPSLLPAFKGSVHAQQDAFEYGCRISGVTIHFVTDDVDGGPVLYQEAVDISACKNAEETAEKILLAEHSAYKKVVDSFSKGTYIVEGRRAIFIRKD